MDGDYPDAFRRQSSLSGEDIKIVIDDVDKIDLDQASKLYGGNYLKKLHKKYLY